MSNLPIIIRDASNKLHALPTDAEIAAFISKTVESEILARTPYLTAFGNVPVAEITPDVTLKFPYNINPALVDSHPNQSGSIDVNNNMARLQTGAAANSSAELSSVSPVEYRPGQGGLCRFTCVFDTPVVGSVQEVGVGDIGDGFFFGYSGTDFGVVIRKGGGPEIRTLTVTTKSSTAENITITLNSIAKTDVAVTDASIGSGDLTTTANDIAAADYSDVGRGWDAFAVGDTVIFISWGDAARTGTYSLSGASTAVGAVVQTVAGLEAVETFVNQTTWSADKLDGVGDSAFVLNKQMGNVYMIQYQWLGFGDVEFYIENPATGKWLLVHLLSYANANTTPTINDPVLHLYGGILNTTNDTNMTLFIGSMMGGVEGREELLGPRHGFKNFKVLTGVATETPIMTIRNKLVYHGRRNRVKVKIVLVSAAVEHTKPVTMNFYGNAILTGASFSEVNAATSVIEKDTSATAFTGGVLLFSIDLGKEGQILIDLSSDVHAGPFLPGFTITGAAAPNSGNNAEASVAFNVVELF